MASTHIVRHLRQNVISGDSPQGRFFRHPEPPKGRTRVWPVYISFQGCPGRCVFCAQAVQAGAPPVSLGETLADMERELQRRGLTYTARRFTLEFGQPFLSLDDAQTFFRLYSRDGAVPSRQELAQRLELSAWADYPLYLPNPKPLCLLAIPAAQLREEMYG